MEIQKTLTCPNCGANITNLQNCEFCGSLLIRLQQIGIQLANSDYNDNAKVLPGLIKALQDNLAMQTPTNWKIVSTEMVGLDNGKQDILGGVLSSVVDHNYVAFFPNDKDGKKHLEIAFAFWPNFGDELTLEKFKKLDIYDLFIGRSTFVHNTKCNEFAIDFGEDVEGAARLISKVLHEVYGVAYSTHLEYYTNRGNDDITKCRNQILGIEEPVESIDESAWYNSWWAYAIAVAIGTVLFRMCSFD
jgi:hypothetical protein